MSRVVWRVTPEFLLDRIRPAHILEHQPVTFLAVRHKPFEGGYIEILVDDPLEAGGAVHEGEVAPWWPVNS